MIEFVEDKTVKKFIGAGEFRAHAIIVIRDTFHSAVSRARNEIIYRDSKI